MKYSFVLSHKTVHVERKRNIQATLRWFIPSVEKLGDTEIIVVEQGAKKTIEHIPEFRNDSVSLKYIFIHHSGLFNKSWGYNVGARYAQGSTLFFIDNDIILPFESINKGLDLFEFCDAVRCYDRLYALNDAETNAFSDSLQYPPESAKILRDFSVPGGFLIIRKELYKKLGGWDEDFEGWGGEDTAFEHKLSPYRIAAVSEVAYHLHHQNFGVYLDEDNFSHVKKVYRYIRSLSHAEILRRATNTIIGDTTGPRKTLLS